MSGLPIDHERYARAVLPDYGRDPDTPLRLLSVSENAIYLVDDPDPMVLRVHRPGYHSLAAIRSELSWMTALRDQTTVLTPRSIHTDDGRDVVSARPDGAAADVYVDAVTFIPGCTAEEQPDAVGFEELGRMTAVMHRHVQNWVPPTGFTRFRWDVDTTIGARPRWGSWRRAVGLDSGDVDTIERAAATVIARLNEFGCENDRFGLIHGDLRMANLMVDPTDTEAPITVIDFDDSGWSWYLADLGAVVSFIEHTPLAETIIADWLYGYRDVCALPPAHLEMVPTFVMLRRLMLTGWLASHADADAALAYSDGYAAGTVQLARRYVGDRDWLRDAVFSTF
ncbi:phosphotransferase enzyme family protein [Mycolicibacterium thermoresistibile]